MSDAAPERDGGQSTVELAMCLPLVAVVLLAVLQVASIGRDHVLVAHAAREAARAAAVGAEDAAAAAAAAASTGLDPARLHVAVEGRGPAGSPRTVTVRYRSRTDIPVTGRLVGDVEVHARVVIRAE